MVVASPAMTPWHGHRGVRAGIVMVPAGDHGNGLREPMLQCSCGWFSWEESLVEQDMSDQREGWVSHLGREAACKQDGK